MVKILAVDDELPIRQWLQFCISQMKGVDCTTAANGSEALEAFLGNRPDIILTDIEMPGISGMEFISKIRQVDKQVTIIVLTSHSNFNYARTALKLDVHEYILKTEMTEDGLREILGKVVSSVRSQRLEKVRTIQNARETVAQQELRQMESIQSELMEALLNQDYTLAYRKLQEAISEATKNPSLSDSTKRLLKSMCLSFLYFAKDSSEIGAEQELLFKEKLDEADTASKVRRAAEEVCEPLIRDYTGVTRYSEPVHRAILFIQEHHSEKITLTDTAEQLGYNPEYFSRIFGKETGVSFVAFVNNLRMKQAVNLLETTEWKVYEIAEKVGYSSLSYFSTTFKKKIGMNPYEYQVKWKTNGRKKPKA